MIIRLMAFLGLACVLAAQGPVVPAGLIYQAAAESGIAYIEPTAGQAIINQKAGLNWHNVIGQVLSDGSIGVLTAGLSGVIHVPIASEIALAAFHAYYDHTIAPIIGQGAPNPGSIASVLPMTGAVAPSAAQCVESSMYAVYTKGTRTIGPVMVQGLSVTFSPQGVQVLRNISGQRVKQFQVIDVLICVPGSIVLPLPPAPVVKTATDIPAAPAWITTGELASLASPVTN